MNQSTYERIVDEVLGRASSTLSPATKETLHNIEVMRQALAHQTSLLEMTRQYARGQHQELRQAASMVRSLAGIAGYQSADLAVILARWEAEVPPCLL
jgi:hypothetical protein